MPSNLGALLRSYDRVIVPEMNTGQLKTLLRDQFLVDARPVNKVSGQPFKIAEIEAAIEEALQDCSPAKAGAQSQAQLDPGFRRGAEGDVAS